MRVRRVVGSGSKDKSYRAIPASRVVVEMIRGQVNHVRQRHGDTCRWLFPKVMANPDGKYPMPYGTVDTRLNAWMSRIRLIDANGDPATVSWHQFRHTLGTRMANAGVSGRTIREVLGHTSWRMQEHYSRIADDTLPQRRVPQPLTDQPRGYLGGGWRAGV